MMGSAFAMNMQLVAQGWLVYEMTESPIQLTWVTLSFMLPQVIFSLIGGVLADRIRTEYNIPVTFEPTDLFTARWIDSDNIADLNKFFDENKSNMATDHDGASVFMARNLWHLNKAVDDWPAIKFNRTKEQA